MRTEPTDMTHERTLERQPFRLSCLRCGDTRAAEFRFRCDCGGALEPRFDLDRVCLADDAVPEVRYFDLLPLRSPDSVAPGASVRTPCVPAPSLGALIGVPNLWLKDETRQPSGSTKDRMASIVVAVLKEWGVEEFVSSSTGNSSSSLARIVGMTSGMRVHLFAGSEFAPRHRFIDNDAVTLHVHDGDFVAATAAAAQFARERGVLWEGGFFNWARREGLKLAYLEAAEQMDRPADRVVQAVSSGMGIVGARKGYDELVALGFLPRLPRLTMVQQASCNPMVRAWQAGRAEMAREDVVDKPSGIATAILRGDGTASYPYLHDIARSTGGLITSVTEDEMRHARTLLAEHMGMASCYAGAATLAAVARLARTGEVGEDEVVLLNITGSSL